MVLKRFIFLLIFSLPLCAAVSPNEFIENFIETIKYSMPYLKDRGHYVVFIKDLQPKEGKTKPIAFAAPVLVGIIELLAVLALLRSE